MGRIRTACARKLRSLAKWVEREQSDLTIVVQGPQHWLGYSNIPAYQKYGHVLVSTYVGQGEYLEGKYPDITIVRNPLPDFTAHNYHNILLQAWSSVGGLKQVKTKFAIKVRSDESYGKLTPVIEKLRSNPDKLITNNIFFANVDTCPFQPSDHLQACRTDKLLKGWEQVIEYCKQLGWRQLPGDGGLVGLPWFRRDVPNEVLFFMGYLKANGIGIGDLGERRNDNLIRRIMKENVEVVSMRDLLPQAVWSQSSKQWGRLYFTEFNQDNVIHKMDEL